LIDRIFCTTSTQNAACSLSFQIIAIPSIVKANQPPGEEAQARTGSYKMRWYHLKSKKGTKTIEKCNPARS
jgi:hypothetical protein